MRRSALILLGFASFFAQSQAFAGGTEPGDLANGGMFLDADTCSNCHGGGFEGDETYLPTDTWAGTMMANAARDPVFYAALAQANEEVPDSGTFCLRCHSPTSYVRGNASPPFADGSALDAIDLHGVGCETCHRATQDPVQTGYLVANAQMFYDDDHGKRGKYPDSVSPNHEAIYDLGVTTSAFCGQCHEVENPLRNARDAAGTDLGFPFKLETTYSEYLASDYAKAGNALEATCQDCHMAKKVGDYPLTSIGGVPRTDPREHAFVGANHWGIRAVMEANPQRASDYATSFELAKQRTLENMAKGIALSIEDAPSALTGGASFDVTVRVENLTGHKYPTGYVDGRRAWIALVLVDADGIEHPLLGDYDTATGDIVDTPATHVYRAEHGQWDGVAITPVLSLVMADGVAYDSRIPPKGFVPDASTAILGDISYDDGAGGVRSFDEATFTVTAPSAIYGDATLEARVMHQTMTREYVEHLRTAGGASSKGEELYTIYQATEEAAPIVAAFVQAPVNFGEEPTGAGGAGGGGGAGAAGGGGAGIGGEGGAETTSTGSGAASPGGDGCSCEIVGAPTNPEPGALWALVCSVAVAVGLSARKKKGEIRPHA